MVVSSGVVAIETDPALLHVLREKFAAALASGQLQLMHADVREVELRSVLLEHGHRAVGVVHPERAEWFISDHRRTCGAMAVAPAVVPADATDLTRLLGDSIVTTLDVTLFAHASPTAFALASTGRKFLPR